MSNHKNGILSEDGVAISEKGWNSMSREDLIRIVSIPDRKYLDYFLKDFEFRKRPEPELRSKLYARMNKKQRLSLLNEGKNLEFAWS